MGLDKKKLAVIHIVKGELGLSDAQYRDILRRAAGVESAKDLDEEKFRRLMSYFVRSPHYRLNPSGLTVKQMLYMKHLVSALGWDAAHVENFLLKYYHKRTLEALTKQEAIKVIESLKNISYHRHATPDA